MLCRWLSLGLLGLLAGCGEVPTEVAPPFDAAFARLSPLEAARLPLATRFELPMGGENGALVYNAQPFRVTRHLGDDWNGIGGWNSDQGDAVYASGTGKVVYAGVPGPGWGNMVILAHRVADEGAVLGWSVYQTVYAHLESVEVKPGEVVERGRKVGTVGTADGQYLAHLHFEVRRSDTVYPGAGYANAPLDRVSPASFIRAHGGLEGKIFAPAPLAVGE
jgi:murein DD-endopeptidase MepM/ murein hydrolase activator NlpD